MKVAVRADASVAIGTGHVMRCLTLADALRGRGASVSFLCQQATGDLGSLIAGKGYLVRWLPSGSDSYTDARASLEALAAERPLDWLVADHYALGSDWEHSLRSAADRIMAIDDIADRTHDCDLLLDPNLQESGRYARLVPESCRTLIGPEYALLRPEFAAARTNLGKRNGRVSRLLIFFGGSDPGGETLKAITAIQMLGRTDLDVDVVVGATNPHRKAIESACQGMPKTKIYCQVDDMATRMLAADLFVGAGGTSSWERCCLGLPALVIATADNQIAQSVALAKAGVHRYLGLASSVAPERLAREISALILQPEALETMADLGKALVDGLGAERVRKCLYS